MKLRNLILSLFLTAGAAAFTACDGTTGPAGVAGSAGPAGPAGAAGDAGKAGDSADEVMRSYAYLKTWGKKEGKAACSDPVLTSDPDAFPGPATLPKLPASGTVLPLARTSVETLLSASDTADPTSTSADDQGKCSNAVFTTTPSNAPLFAFETLSNGTTNSNPMTETPRKGTTPTLRNATLTEVKKWFREGRIVVNLNNNGSEYAERDLLFTRCDIGRTPFGGLQGTYRVIKITEDEFLLKTDAQGTAAKDTGTKVTKTTSKICVRFSGPGTVKCYITETAEKRSTSTDAKVTGGDVTTEQIVLYKDGKMTPVDPMPNKMNVVPGKDMPVLGTKRPFGGSGTTAANNPPFVTFFPNKLCNFFAGVVGAEGAAAAAPPSTGGGGGGSPPGGGGGSNQAACEAAGVGEGTTRAPGTWSSGSCNCPTNSAENAQGQCICSSGGTWRSIGRAPAACQ